MHVIGINLIVEEMMLDDGVILPITDWIDGNGNECSKQEAEFCIAGPDLNGRWYNAAIEEFSDEQDNFH